MGEFIVELLNSLIASLVPQRVADMTAAVLMLAAGVAFATLGVFVISQVVTKQAEPRVALGALLFFGLTYVCARLALKGFRSTRSPRVPGTRRRR